MISIGNNAAAMLLSAAAFVGTMIPANAFQTGTQTQQKQPSLKEPPMAFKWPVVGTLPDFFARGGVDGLSDVYQSMYTDFGSIHGTSLMGENELVICDPNVYDAVCRKEGKWPIGGAEGVTTFVDYYKENNLTVAMKGVANGPGWAEWRKSLAPDMFSHTAVSQYLPTIASTCSSISKVAGYEITQKQNIEFVDFISRAAFDMFTAVMYGESPQTTNSEVALNKDVEFVKASQAAFDITGVLITNPLEKVFGGNLYQEFEVNMDKTFNFAAEKTKDYADQASTMMQQQQQQQMQQDQMMEQDPPTKPKPRRRKRDIIKGALGLSRNTAKKTHNVDETTSSSKCPIQFGEKNPSFVERLVNRGEMSNDEISEVAAPLLMAGVDTTAYVMSWLYLNLASNPEVQSKLAAELKEVLNGADVTTAEQMDSLLYLNACIRESHRLTPAAPISQKRLKQDIDVVVGDSTYHVKAGERITLNLRAYPMDAQYVESPNNFQPERFMPNVIKARKGTPSEIIDHPSFVDPFGRGKRRCLGGNMAMAEILILTARMIQDWEILLVDPSVEWKPKQKLMLKADPYPAMRVVARKS